MHPLRFPNSGLRAKVFMRKIGLKLCVMILNRVESFYALLLCFHNKDNKERGWQAMARPPAGVASHGQSPCKAGHPRPCSWLQPRPPTRGWPATAKAPCRGSRQHARPPAGMASACRGDTCGRRQHPRLGRRGGCPLRGCKGQPHDQGCRLQGRPLLQGQQRLPTPAACSVAACAGQRRWWQRCSEGKGRGLGHPLRKG
ncbi:hypothetical protein GW17_00058622 [Ensete ventricosum]|nr:hypothetical protein GW17_00058622 [Ensete ventricosum]